MRREHRDVRRPVLGLTLVALILSGCTGDADDSTEETAASAGSGTAASEAIAAPAPPVRSGGTGSRLDCGGGQLAIGAAGRRAAPAKGRAVLRDSPTQVVRRWLTSQLAGNAYWRAAGPLTIEHADARTKSGQRKIRVTFRGEDGRAIGSIGVLWDEKNGWVGGGFRSCAGAESDRDAVAVPGSNLVIYQAMFSPRAVSSRLTCSLTGSGGYSVVSDAAAPRRPLTPWSPEQAVAKFVSEQSHRANPDWDEAAPPTPRYYYPRDPAAAYRVVVDFLTPEGRTVASLQLDRWPDSDTWHVGFMQSCAYPPPNKKA